MDKFWEWMKDKGYAKSVYVSNNFVVKDENEECFVPTKQMLIGYKIQYISENSKEAYLHLSIINLNCIVNLDRQLNRIIEEIQGG